MTSSSARRCMSAGFIRPGSLQSPPLHSSLETDRITLMRKSPAQVYALVFGVTLLLAGILGFFYTADFSTGHDAGRDALIGVFDVNGWHNLVHIASGLLGLALARSWRGAKLYAWGFGTVYLAVAIWGFVIGDGESIAGLIPI